MAGFLNNPASSPHDIQHATWLENVPKIVISKSIEAADWNNTILIKEHVIEEINKLKQMPGNDFVILGSPTLSHYLMQHELIDEYRLTVSPVVLGSGIPLFTGMEQTKLNLLDTRRLRSGVVILHYEAKRPYSSIVHSEKHRANEISTTVTRQK